MSIIEEALRRKQEEGTEPGAPRTTPPPLPETGGGGRKPSLAGPMLLLFLLLLSAGAAVYFLWNKGMSGWSRFAVGREPEPPAAAAEPGGTSGGTSAVLQGLVDDLNRMAATPPEQIAEAVPDESGPAPEPAGPEPAVALPGRAEPAGPAPAWPDLLLKGVLASRGSNPPMVMIDDRILSVNDEYKGVRIAEIEGKAVVFQMGPHRRRLFVGESMP